jgi:hypothetical protein
MSSFIVRAGVVLVSSFTLALSSGCAEGGAEDPADRDEPVQSVSQAMAAVTCGNWQNYTSPSGSCVASWHSRTCTHTSGESWTEHTSVTYVGC